MALPEKLGKYSIVEVLGKGAMGVVYKGFDPHIRRTVALKVIRKEIIDESKTAGMIARFKNEAQAAGRLSHPGIVSVYEYGEDEEIAYIAMEYVQGKGLRDYFHRGSRFGMADVASIMNQLLEALAYAHDEGVIHRDIKPANIIIMVNGRLKVADFGIAHLDSSKLTHTGVIMGTPGYMAPEQYTGLPVDRRADIFSSGVVLYQLLTNVKPFTGTTETVAYRICYEPHIEPSRVAPELIGTSFDLVVARALAKKPEDRFHDAREFQAAIQAAHAAPVSPVVSEETIIDEASGATTPAAQRSQTGSEPGVTTLPPPGWDGAVLAQIEKQLARYLGPVAKVIVRRGAKSTKELDTLYALLSESLNSDAEKQEFRAGRAELLGVPAAQSESTGEQKATSVSGDAPVDPADVDYAVKLMAAELGPIARVVVKKAAAQAANRREFLRLVGEHLGSDAEREQFARKLMRRG